MGATEQEQRRGARLRGAVLGGGLRLHARQAVRLRRRAPLAALHAAHAEGPRTRFHVLLSGNASTSNNHIAQSTS